jgi:hypothetical protein
VGAAPAGPGNLLSGICPALQVFYFPEAKEVNRMRFEFEEQTSSAPAERQLLPEGVHEMEIVHAEEGPNNYKTGPGNPDGMCLKLRLKQGDYKFVFDDIAQHLGWRAKQLAAAIGNSPDGSAVSLEPDDLIGVTLAVEVNHYTSKAGRLSAVVKRYLPAGDAKEPPARRDNKRPKSSAVALTNEHEDDIPF